MIHTARALLLTFSLAASMVLTPEQSQRWEDDGYLVIPDFFPSEEADALRIQAHNLLDVFDPKQHSRTIFKSKDTEAKQEEARTTSVLSQDDKVAEDEESYFLNSADKISYLLEEHALAPNGDFLFPKERSVNKIAHALHVLDPIFGAFSNHSRVKDMTQILGFTAPIILQSMVIFKQPRVGGKVSKHRDNTFLTTDPVSAVGMWFALEDTTVDNGCLWFVPGSHKDGASSKRFVRTGPLRHTVNQYHLDGDIPTNFVGEAPNNRGVELLMTGRDLRPYLDEEFVPVPIKKGSLILIHGEVVHMSQSNLSDKSRNIYTFHVVEAFNTSFPATTWLQSSNPFPHLLTPKEEESRIRAKLAGTRSILHLKDL